MNPLPNLSIIFDNHAAFNKFQSIYGMRPKECGTKPSIYITIIKLRKALSELSDIDIENIYGKEMTAYNCRLHRKKLFDKMETTMHGWQILSALNILMEQGRYESISYVKTCRYNDKEPK